MDIINLTGEPITLCGKVIPGAKRRKAYIQSKVEEIAVVEWKGGSVPLLESVQGGVMNLPPPLDNTIYVVKGLVAGEAGLTLERQDVYTLSRVGPDGEAHALLRIKGDYDDDD